jgi:hypothetical protein
VKRVNTDHYLVLHNVTSPKAGDTVIYNGQCRFLKTDRKTHVVIIDVFNDVKLYCDLSDLVPVDGDYNHYHHLKRV